MSPNKAEQVTAQPAAHNIDGCSDQPAWGFRRALPLESIRADDRAQPRAALLSYRINEYEDDIVRGDEFPPLIVFEDCDGVRWLADGFHRYHAYVGVCAEEVDCIVHRGELRDAILFSVGANAAHGLRRTNDDKRQAVAKLLKDDEWREWSDHEIARRCHVEHHMVARLRTELQPVTRESPSERTYRTKHGTTAKMNTGRVGKAKPTKDPDITAAADRAEARSEENRRNAEARDGLVTGKPPNRFAPDVAMAPHAERGLDVYETPPVAVHALLKVESLVAGRIWEPACGPGAIVRVLRDRGHDVVASDIKDYGCPDSRGDVDFLKQAAAPDGATVILTNPPYRRSNRFVRLALKYAPLVIMLLPIRFLEGERRSDILEGGKLRCIYVFRNRLPMMHRHGWRGAKIDKGKAAYAWFVWDAGHSGPATIHHISWEAADAERATPADDGAIPEFLRRTEAERS